MYSVPVAQLTLTQALLLSFPDSHALSTLRSSITQSSSSPSSSSHQHMHLGEEGECWEWNTWEENWNNVVKPLILRDEGGYHREWM